MKPVCPAPAGPAASSHRLPRQRSRYAHVTTTGGRALPALPAPKGGQGKRAGAGGGRRRRRSRGGAAASSSSSEGPPGG